MAQVPADWKRVEIALTHPVQHPETSVTVSKLTFHEPSTEELEEMEDGAAGGGAMRASIIMLEVLLDDQAMRGAIRKLHIADFRAISEKLTPFVKGSGTA